MMKSKFTYCQIMDAVKQFEAGFAVPDICIEQGISTATFCMWQAKYSGMDVSMMARIKELEEENRRLKKMYLMEKLIGMEVNCSLLSERVIWELKQIISWRGKPQVISCDNGRNKSVVLFNTRLLSVASGCSTLSQVTPRECLQGAIQHCITIRVVVTVLLERLRRGSRLCNAVDVVLHP